MINKYRKFIRRYFIFLLLILFFVSSVNFFVDPGNIYDKKIFSKNTINKYIDTLLNSSSFGVIQEGWNERDVKVALVKKADSYDCAIIGSSHAMQIGTRTLPSLKNLCSSSMNFSVSGGSLEDIVIFSSLIDDYSNSNKVVIEIDPWSFKFDMDTRWQSNKGIYNEFIEKLEMNNIKNNNLYIIHLMRNLLNYEYFLESLKSIKKKIKTGNSNILVKTQIDYEKGGATAITLSDGSHIYPNKYIKQQSSYTFNPTKDEADYKIKGIIYDQKAVELFVSTVKLLQKKGKEVIFLLTPYHPKVFQGDRKIQEHISKMNIKIKQISDKLNINVYGSYYSQVLGCSSSEFYDYMHPKLECLNKINFNERENK